MSAYQEENRMGQIANQMLLEAIMKLREKVKQKKARAQATACKTEKKEPDKK